LTVSGQEGDLSVGKGEVLYGLRNGNGSVFHFDQINVRRSFGLTLKRQCPVL
jgi:hypothetical protein